MRGLTLTIGAAAMLQVATAMCPNLCSGHGACGADDKCRCHPNFQGASCIERVCPFETAWNLPVSASEHSYVECSNKGVCDRAIGQCICQDGFTGEACQRMSCPNDCNGKGQCKTLADIAISAGGTYSGWDAEKIQSCVCDPGYSGIDCSKRMCKLGDDPHSIYTEPGAEEVHQVQEIVLGSTGFAVGDEFVLHFTDWRGHKWTTRPLFAEAGKIKANSIKEALESLPQRVIPEVQVEVMGTPSATSVTFTVAFVSPETPGEQPLLEVGTAGCILDGCQPVYNGITDTASGVVTVSTPGTTQRLECSGRGTCDTEQGVCVCADGNRGEACEKLTLVF